MTGRRLCAAGLCLVVALAATPALHAQPASAEDETDAPAKGDRPVENKSSKNRTARAHFLRAEKAFNLAKFTEALAAYEAAYEVRPLPALLFNIAQCHRNLGDHERAVFFYRRYLTLEPRSKNRELVQDLIAEEEQEQERERAARAAIASPRPAPSPAVTDQLLTAAPPAAEPGKPLYRRWWVWAIAGVAVAGITTALLYPRQGDLPRGQLESVDRR